ncbi:basic proline-rich protein-like [Canis lupus familiaris]|uniref:basic proline-rich protein-like n=1 Tax=Canis lupus familiaris TaxID=9615 RepID=UPI0018F4AC2C|nr:basic proline-rich protein-like [Canis lupus familiaris]
MVWGDSKQAAEMERKEERPPPLQSPALPPAPRGGWLGPAPLPDATTCARSGAAFVRRFTAERAPRARPDLAPGPGGEAERRAGPGQAGPRTRGPAVTWRRSDNFDPPAPPRTRPPLRTVSAGPPAAHTRFSNRLPSVFRASLPPRPTGSGLHYPRPQCGPRPQPPISNHRSAPSAGGRPPPWAGDPAAPPPAAAPCLGDRDGGGGAAGGGAGALPPAHSEASPLHRGEETTGVLPPSAARDARAAAARPSCHPAAATHPAPSLRGERPPGAVTSRRAALPDGGTVAPDPGEGGGASKRAAAPASRRPSPGQRRGRRGSGRPQAPAGLESGGWNPPGALNSRAPRCCVSASSWGPGPGGRSGGRGRAGPSGGRERLAGAGGRRGPDGRGRQPDGRAAGAGLRDPLRRSRFPHKLPESGASAALLPASSSPANQRRAPRPAPPISRPALRWPRQPIRPSAPPPGLRPIRTVGRSSQRRGQHEAAGGGAPTVENCGPRNTPPSPAAAASRAKPREDQPKKIKRGQPPFPAERAPDSSERAPTAEKPLPPLPHLSDFPACHVSFPFKQAPNSPFSEAECGTLIHSQLTAEPGL